MGSLFSLKWLNLLTSAAELEIELDRRQKIELRTVDLARPLDKPKIAEYQYRQIERGIKCVKTTMRFCRFAVLC